MEISASAREKRNERYAAWLGAEGVQFKSPETEAKYKANIQRLIDAVELDKTPDRVPIYPLTTFMVPDLYNLSPGDAMYDYPRLMDVNKKYTLEYDPDFYCSPLTIGSGKVLEILGYKLYKWPKGGGLKDSLGYQCLEKEYMSEDDYQWLIDDPSDFWMRGYTAKTFEALAPLADIPSFTGLWEIVGVSPWAIPFGIPPVQDALKALIEAGNEAMNWIHQVGDHEMELKSYGYPAEFGGVTKAPYDVLADTLRGTRAMMLDLYRRPEKVLQAMDRIVNIFTRQGIATADMANNPIVFMPLHKGADGFMSDEQFKEFYWPTFKQVVMNLVEAGCVPYLFAEGGFNSRLEYLKELPRKSCFWIFDRTDMQLAKTIIGDNLCIGGNVPAGLLLTGKPQGVKDYCKDLIDTCGKGGGYIMAFGTGMDEGNPENIKAMYDFTKEYGRY